MYNKINTILYLIYIPGACLLPIFASIFITCENNGNSWTLVCPGSDSQEATQAFRNFLNVRE